MITSAQPAFPNVSIPVTGNRPPVQVHLIAQLGIGTGTALVRSAARRQAADPGCIDALDEPSLKLSGLHPASDDRSSLYSFVVESGGHPFHAHAGPRVFTALSGSDGAQLRFSGLSESQAENDPDAFARSLHVVDIPPDCLFTVRFGSHVWHQFAPSKAPSRHPALFAISCHPDELYGIQDPELARKIMSDQADIPTLTRLLPTRAREAAAAVLRRTDDLQRTLLSLQGPTASWRRVACAMTRSRVGWLRAAAWPSLAQIGSRHTNGPPVIASHDIPRDSLVGRHFNPKRVDHQDQFTCTLRDDRLAQLGAAELMDRLLTAFVSHPPRGVTLLMRLRNALVMPLRLRRSRLGCPVSSLGSLSTAARFRGRHPVLAQESDAGDRHVQVMLGADDRHLAFRTNVSVEIRADDSIRICLANRVDCHNAFGRFYMAVIDQVHRRYISPRLMRKAISQVQSSV
jgi:hypothetical protein